MVTYQGEVFRYYSDQEAKEKLIKTIESKDYHSPYNIDEEYLKKILVDLNDYLNSYKSESHTETLERHETEEEARAYFGEDFIKKYDELLTRLKNEQTIVAIHGTSEERCAKICNEGLDSSSDELWETASLQNLPYETDENIHFDNYESLLNWRHRNYKGLIIIGVPYECFYKEGLWKDKGIVKTHPGDLKYRLNPDFIAGYINVTEKKLVLNPKYNRKHDYTGLEKDSRYYKESGIFNNEEALRNYKEHIISVKENAYKPEESEYEDDELEIDFNYLSSKIEGILTDAKMMNTISQEDYKTLLSDSSKSIEYIKKYIDKLHEEKERSKETTEEWTMPQETIDTTTFDYGVFQNSDNPFPNYPDNNDDDVKFM